MGIGVLINQSTSNVSSRDLLKVTSFRAVPGSAGRRLGGTMEGGDAIESCRVVLPPGK